MTLKVLTTQFQIPTRFKKMPIVSQRAYPIVSTNASSNKHCSDVNELLRGGSWNAGDWPRPDHSYYVEYDLGTSMTIVRIDATVNQLPDGDTSHFVKCGNNPAPTIVLGQSHGHTSSGQLLSFPMLPNTQARYIRIETTKSPSWVA